MIRVICNQETFVYNAYHMVKAFYPSETVVIQKVVRAKWQNSCMGNPDGSTTD